MEYPFFEVEEVIETHDSQLLLGGGEPGILDRGLLDSALAQPRAGMFGHFFHHDAFEMAAAYLYHIGKNHAFVDGNKRTAVAIAIDFLGLQDFEIDATPLELGEFALRIIEGDNSPSQAKEEAANFFRRRSKKIEEF
jgi:death-on-curing protein